MLLLQEKTKNSNLINILKAVDFDGLFFYDVLMDNKSEKLFTPNFMLSFTANFLMMIAFYILMPTLPVYFIDTLGLDKSMVGVLVSIYIISAVIVRPFSGYLIDMIERKPFYVAIFLVYTLVFGGYLLFSTFVMLLAIRIVHGAIWGVIIPLGNTLAIDIMPAGKRGSGIGYYGMSSNLAMALGPVIGLVILESHGFSSIVLVSIGFAILGVLAALFIKAPHKEIVKHNGPLSLDRFILVKAIPLGVNIMIVSFSYGAALAYTALYGKEIGVHNTGLFFILLAAGVILARLMSGKYIDRGKFDQISAISLVMFTVGFALLGLVKNSIAYFSMALFIGVACGMLFPVIQTMIVNLGTHHQRGTATSTYFTAFDVGIGAGMLFGGIIADFTSLSVIFVIAAVLNLIATVFYLRVSSPHYKRYHL